MSLPFNVEFGRDLDRMERLLARPGRYRIAGRELQRYLDYLHHKVARGLAGARLDSDMHEMLHELMRRTRSIRNPQDAKDLIHDVRNFQINLSSLSHASEVESRLHELEERTKEAPKNSLLERAPEADDLTLENLIGKRVLFAIMPFNDNFEDVWTGGIKRAASGTGYTPIRIDMLTQSSEITDDIVQGIRMSEVIVVDVTGNNPNVMFEFGFALALKKKPVVISQSTEFLTFDIKNLRTLIYKNSWQGIESLHKELQPFIKGASGKKVRRRKAAKKKRPEKTVP